MTLSRRNKWVLAAAIVVAILLLAITPPLVNVNRLQRRIASSMSASLGRPVHLDSVSLHLLPVPGFTLQNLVVSEDPAFGNEPVIRANIVEARLRPSSLWRRQVEFSTLRFIEPSLNLVHNAAGEWNLQSLLMHAASVESAPTAQQKAGPAPRFPYIEATGARVNVKNGMEKLPFSLTDADFALWLPSPERWRVRLEGRPARTDTSISDPGVISLEGSLDRPQGGVSMTHVAVDMHAAWRKAPLGEASKLVSGDDQNWRGNLTVELAVKGPLDAAAVTFAVHVEDLHRADFYPARTVDLQVDCAATVLIPAAALREVLCKSPAGSDGKGAIVLRSAALSMNDAQAATAELRADHVPVDWAVDWVRLWSARIPLKTVDGTLDAVLLLSHHPEGWSATGSADLTAPWLAAPAKASGDAASMPPPVMHWTVLPSTGAVLTPLYLKTDPGTDVALSATISQRGYDYSLDGAATQKDLAAGFAFLPPLGDDMPGSAVDDGKGPAAPAAAESQVTRLDVSCTRPWEQVQTCHPAPPPPAPAKPHRRRR